jgi:hypothetical protein
VSPDTPSRRASAGYGASKPAGDGAPVSTVRATGFDGKGGDAMEFNTEPSPEYQRLTRRSNAALHVLLELHRRRLRGPLW